MICGPGFESNSRLRSRSAVDLYCHEPIEAVLQTCKSFLLSMWRKESARRNVIRAIPAVKCVFAKNFQDCKVAPLQNWLRRNFDPGGRFCSEFHNAQNRRLVLQVNAILINEFPCPPTVPRIVNDKGRYSHSPGLTAIALP
jgi:hypothetical protein